MSGTPRKPSVDAPVRTVRIDGIDRDLAIDSLRGIAIVLMVAGHVIGSSSAAGMQVSDDSAWRSFSLLLEDVRMPLFTALSGLVYGLRPLRDVSRYPRLVTGKVRRLMVPLASVGIVFLVMQSVVPGTNAASELRDVWKLFVYGTDHFWFLQAIFLIFLLVCFCDAIGLLARPRFVLVAIIVSALVSVLVVVPDPWAVFSINGAIRLLPFFLLGYLFTAHADAVRLMPRTWVLLLGAAVVLFAVRAVDVLARWDLPRIPGTALGVVLGLVAISLLLHFRDTFGWAPIARLGYFSYAIYLLHVFGTAPARIVLLRFGLDIDPLIFATALIAGLALPVLFEISFGRVSWISWLFLGQRPFGVARPQPRPAATTA